MAKPVAVDVPGCLVLQAAEAEANTNGRAFFIDYLLGRQAAAHGTTPTMEQILKENRQLEVNLEGLKA